MADLAIWAGATLAIVFLSTIAYLIISRLDSKKTLRARTLSVVLATIIAIIIGAYGMADGGIPSWGGATWGYAPPGLVLTFLAFLADTKLQSPPPKIEHVTSDGPRKIHWRNGIRRIFYALSGVYFICWGLAATAWLSANPLFLQSLPPPPAGPSRSLRPLESQNPAVQRAISYTQATPDGGTDYATQLVSTYIADRNRSYARALPSWQYAMITEAIRRRTALRNDDILLPSPEGQLIAFPGTASRAEIFSELERLYAGWRWNTEFTSVRACLGSCYPSLGQEALFYIDPSIHCQANLSDQYLSQAQLLYFTPRSCGELGAQLHEKTVVAQRESRSAFGSGIAMMLAAWGAVFIFGKVFWWIIAGFTGARSKVAESI